jgi:hypothetical protein
VGGAGDPFGGHLQQVGVGVGERAIIEPADMQNTDDVLAAEQRHAEHLSDARLPEDRIRHSTRSSTTGHLRFAMLPANPVPTGTRTPCRTSSSNPHGRSGNQLVGAAIAQQHCGGVRVEHRADAGEQFGEEILDVETGQRRVGDGQHIAQLVRRVRRRHFGLSCRPRHQTAVSMRGDRHRHAGIAFVWVLEREMALMPEHDVHLTAHARTD